jgi:hypothetical protein
MANTTPIRMPTVVTDVVVNRSTMSEMISQMMPVTMKTHQKRAPSRTAATSRFS